MKALLKSLLMVLSVGTAQVAAADSFSSVTERLSGGEFQISPGQTQTLPVRDWRYVQKLYINASSYNGGSATIEVITNGTVKGTIYVPSSSPTFVIPVNETIGSIQFRNLSSYNWAKVYDVTGVMSVNTYPVPPVYNPPVYTPPVYNPPVYVPNPCRISDGCTPTRPNTYLPARNQGANIASRAIQLVDCLEPYANYSEYGLYLLPIKKVAAHAYATTANYGDLSLVSRGALLALKQQIAFATTYLDGTFERDAAFQLAVELTSLGQQLDAVLR